MNPKTILITGGTGALGAFLVRYYSRTGYRVIAHGRAKEPPANLLKYAEYVSFDLTKPFTLPSCDICIHTAALSDDKAKLSDLLIANETGTEQLIRQLDVQTKLIHISSSSIYLPQDIPIIEDDAGNQKQGQLSHYGLSKWKSEQIILKKSKLKTVFVLRPRAFYGKGDCVILPRILKLVKGKEIPYIQRPGKMDVAVSLTHYSTIAHAIDCCINSSVEGIHIYNVADKKKYQLLQVVQSLTANLYGGTLSEKEVPIVLLKLLSVFKVGGITKLLVRSFTKNMVLDTSKIERELSFSPSITFDEQIQELGDWVRNTGEIGRHKLGDKKLAWEGF